MFLLGGDTIKKWDRFVKTTNTDIEKRLLHDIRIEKQVLRKLESIFRYDIGVNKIEPNQEKVSYGALYRCCVCLNSILELVSAGYIGSANALFRQVYELLVWAKLAIDNDKTEHLVKIHNDFYCDSENSERNELSSYYSQLRYMSNDGMLDENTIRQEGKYVFKLYSQMIHGGSISQQYPLPSDGFYQNLEGMIQDTALWIMCFSSVLLSYIDKCMEAVKKEYKQQDNCEDSNWLSGLLDRRYMAGNYLSGIVFDQMDKLNPIAPETERTKIYKIFRKTKWIMKG